MPDFQVILSVDISVDIADAEDADDAEIIAYDLVRLALRHHCEGARVPSIQTVEVIADEEN